MPDYLGVLPVPTVAQLSAFTGRPVLTYTSGPTPGYVNAALIQAALQFTVVTELTPDDWNGLTSDDQLMGTYGIMAMADYIYLRQPYQALLASPLMNETIGSYSYSKSMQEVARNAAAMEVTAERTGVQWYDLANQYLAKRTRAGGVFQGHIEVFERACRRYDGAELEIRDCDGQMVLLGPSDFDQIAIPGFDINSPIFPSDPGF